MMPGVPIMRSTDLVNWEIVSYVYDTLENNAAHNLTDGKGIYGKGSWAASLRYKNGTFYVCFASNDMGRTYIYRTTDIVNGPWQRSVLSGNYHDPSLLFDDDGKVYLVYGSGGVSIKELTADATAVKSGGGLASNYINHPIITYLKVPIFIRLMGCIISLIFAGPNVELNRVTGLQTSQAHGKARWFSTVH
jgi:hypothetical protein